MFWIFSGVTGSPFLLGGVPSRQSFLVIRIDFLDSTANCLWLFKRRLYSLGKDIYTDMCVVCRSLNFDPPLAIARVHSAITKSICGEALDHSVEPQCNIRCSA